MITFWTSCKDAVFKDVIQKTLTNTAKGVKYQRVPVREDKIYYPEKGEVVMVMGKPSYELMQKAGIIAKNKGLGKMRGVVVPYIVEDGEHTERKGHWMFTYDPAAPKVDMKKDPELRWDIMLVERFHRTGKLDPELKNCNYEYVDDFSDVVQYIKDKYEFTGKAVDVALDTETMGLVPWFPDKEIVCIQISVEVEQAQVYYMLGAKNKKKVTRQLDWILNTKKASIKGANLKYDLLWLRVKLACTCTNFKFDTLLAGSLINENRSNSLSGHSKEYTTIGGYDSELDAKYDKAHMEDVPKKDLLVYAGGDTDACLRVSYEFRRQLKQQRNLQHFYKTILHPAARVFEEVEYHGLCVDKSRFAEVRKEVVKEEQSCIEELTNMMPRRLRMKHAHRDNLLTPVVLREFLFTPNGLNLKAQMRTPKTGEPTISYDHLMMFLDNPDAKEFISTYKDLNSAQKTLGTYIDGFQKHLRPDGRFHPTYALYAGGLFEGAKDSGTNCFTRDTLINTDKGVVSFSNVNIGDEIISHTGIPRKVIDKFFNGIKPIFRVTLLNGLCFKCTGNHPFYTKQGWINCEDLDLKQEVFVVSNKEDWKEIQEWPYEVSSWGRVRHIKTKNIKKLFFKNEWGHLKVCLSRGCSSRITGNKKDFPVHRLVALAFIINKDNLPEIRHSNGIGWDNRVENLKWGTSLDNSKDAIEHGSMDRTKEKRTKLTWDLVAYIRQSCNSQKKIADEIGVSRELVREVQHYRRWVKREFKDKKVEFFTSSIGQIELLGDRKTYGLTVEEDESHITDGIVTHNTGRTSATNPAIQCLEGSMRVLTNIGWLSIREVVEGYENGQRLNVITHTGKEQPIIDVYRNGVKPVLAIVFEHGKVLTSTGNHPYLTSRGWVRADELEIGDSCYALKGKWFRTSDTELYQPNLLQLGCNEEPLSKQDQQRLQELRGSGNKAVQALVSVPELFGGYGGEAGEGLVNRSERCERELHLGELPMVYCKNSDAKSEKQQTDNFQWENPDRGSLGEGIRNKQRETPLSVDRFGVTYGDSLDEGEVLQCGIFEECRVESITADGECETFDLTIQESHSFVAEGLVVHNTLPKHTKWAQFLRSCYISPPGYVFFQVDFSQGELRITACHANETTMLAAYRRGVDLHAMTGSRLSGYDLDKFLSFKDTKEHGHIFDDFRFKAKATNFGLIYGMQSKGYREYTRTAYDLELSMAEATEQRDMFFDTYPELEFWHSRQGEEARRYKKVVSPLGRVRHLPLIDSNNWSVSSKAERQAINAPIQSTLSDLCMWSMVLIRKRFTMEEVWLAGMTHDSIYGYIPEDCYEQRLAEIKNIMENLPLKEKFQWEPQIPFPVDVEVSHTHLGALEVLNV